MDLLDVFIRLAVAFVCGCAIGSERQIHHRTAGLKTNALVAIGAAVFVLFDFINAQAFGSEFRVSAQIVSGVGFLGGGVILKDGFNIKGLSTAATLWCAAAAGMMAGLGYFLIAAMVSLFVMGINSLLRPLSNLLNKVSPEQGEFMLKISCDNTKEDDVKWLLLKYIESKKMTLKDIKIDRNISAKIQESHLSAIILSKANKNIDDISHKIAKEAKINSIMWEEIK